MLKDILNICFSSETYFLCFGNVMQSCLFIFFTLFYLIIFFMGGQQKLPVVKTVYSPPSIMCASDTFPRVEIELTAVALTVIRCAMPIGHDGL